MVFPRMASAGRNTGQHSCWGGDPVQKIYLCDWRGGVKKFSGDVGVWKWNALITVVMGYCSAIKEAKELVLI